MNKEALLFCVTNLTWAIARRPGNGAHHDSTLHLICTAVRYVCIMDASACSQEMMDNFHFHAVCLSGAWGPPPEDLHIYGNKYQSVSK